MTDPADIPTIREILEDYGVDDFLSSELYAELKARLEARENAMVSDLGPRLWAKHLDRIITEK